MPLSGSVWGPAPELPDSPFAQEFIRKMTSCVVPKITFNYSEEEEAALSDEEVTKAGNQLATDINAAIPACTKQVNQ
jgi:hypothetical protein